MNNIIVFISAFFIVFISNYGECQVFTIYNSQNSGIPFNTVRCLEKQGDVLWVGTDSGLGKFQNNNWEVYNCQLRIPLPPPNFSIYNKELFKKVKK